MRRSAAAREQAGSARLRHRRSGSRQMGSLQRDGGAATSDTTAACYCYTVWMSSTKNIPMHVWLLRQRLCERARVAFGVDNYSHRRMRLCRRAYPHGMSTALRHEASTYSRYHRSLLRSKNLSSPWSLCAREAAKSLTLAAAVRRTGGRQNPRPSHCRLAYGRPPRAIHSPPPLGICAQEAAKRITLPAVDWGHRRPPPASPSTKPPLRHMRLRAPGQGLLQGIRGAVNDPCRARGPSYGGAGWRELPEGRHAEADAAVVLAAAWPRTGLVVVRHNDRKGHVTRALLASIAAWPSARP